MARLLDAIDSPADLKKLSPEQLPGLCQEIRDEIIEACSRTGGHLGSSLGAVEINVALHYVFESPTDRIVWDAPRGGWRDSRKGTNRSTTPSAWGTHRPP
jgi:1-deoxy-D-xylulose-5-phosphate synthase